MGTRAKLGAAAAVVVVGAAIAVTYRGPPDELPAPEGGEVIAEWLADGTPVFVTRRGNEVSVVDARVPRWLDHGLEVHVGFCENWLEAWEPYYASTFDRTGEWTGGPAPGGLATYEAELVDDLVRVGARRPPRPRPDSDEATASGQCAGGWVDPDTLASTRPPAVYHHDGEVGDAIAPEDVHETQDGDPALVLGAVERIDSETVRACAWKRSDVIEGPLCGDDSPEVAEAPFGFLDPSFPAMHGSYGLYLMASENGRLRVQGVLPLQIEYHDEPRRSPAPPSGADS